MGLKTEFLLLLPRKVGVPGLNPLPGQHPLFCKAWGWSATKGSRVGQGDDGASQVPLGPQLGGRAWLPPFCLSVYVQRQSPGEPLSAPRLPPSLVLSLPPPHPPHRLLSG